MPVNPASPIPRRVRSTNSPAKEVATDCKDATIPQLRTIAVTYMCAGIIFHNTLIHSKHIYAI